MGGGLFSRQRAPTHGIGKPMNQFWQVASHPITGWLKPAAKGLDHELGVSHLGWAQLGGSLGLPLQAWSALSRRWLCSSGVAACGQEQGRLAVSLSLPGGPAPTLGGFV